jgi:transposase
VSLSQVNGCLSCQHEVSLERLLPHLCGTVVDAAELAGGWLCIWARARAEATVCPRCGQSSARVHSAYQRRLADTPVGGHRVVIRLTVRRFFCANPDCPAVTFAEQIDGLTSRRARRTPPLARALAGIALALAGRAGARLAALLGLVASRSGLLRLIMALPVPAPGPVRVLGVDLSRLCDYRDCWRAAAADAVVAGVREAARGGPGRDNHRLSRKASSLSGGR